MKWTPSSPNYTTQYYQKLPPFERQYRAVYYWHNREWKRCVSSRSQSRLATDHISANLIDWAVLDLPPIGKQKTSCA